jgi:hypothetical protein
MISLLQPDSEMQMHPALTDFTRPRRPIFLDGSHGVDILCTVGDEARFIRKLPRKYDGLAFALTCTGLESVVANPGNQELLDHVTNEVEFGLLDADLTQRKRWIS